MAGLRRFEPGGGRGSGTSCSLIDRWPSSRSRNRSTWWSWNRGSGRSRRRLNPMQPGRSLVIPVLYDGADLHVVAARLGLSSAEVIAMHSSVEYDVFAVGFLPGFPYAGYLPPALAGLPRRDSPRLNVPAGSVAIVGRQTAIYPRRSPGGWHLLGTTPLCIADVEAGLFPDRGRRPHPVQADFRRRIRGQTR